MTEEIKMTLKAYAKINLTLDSPLKNNDEN